MADFLSLRNDSLNDVIASARAGLAQGSKSPGDYLWLAQLLAASKQLDEAEPLLRKAVELDPSQSETWLALTAYLSRAGRADDARREKALLDAIQKPPEGEFSDFLKKLGEKPAK